MPPDKRSGPEGPPHIAAAKQANTRIVPDRGVAERRRAARELEQLGSLVTFYGPRPLRPVSLAEFLAERWWAA
jgi:hypothetical protein